MRELNVTEINQVSGGAFEDPAAGLPWVLDGGFGAYISHDGYLGYSNGSVAVEWNHSLSAFVVIAETMGYFDLDGVDGDNQGTHTDDGVYQFEVPYDETNGWEALNVAAGVAGTFVPTSPVGN